MDTLPEPPPPEPAPLPPAAKKTWAQRLQQRPILRIACFYLVFGGAAFALLGIYGLLQKLLPASVRPHAAADSLIGETALAASTLLAFWVMVRFVDRRPWATAGLTSRSLLPQTLLGFGIGAALLSVSVGLLWVLGIYHVTGHGAAGFLLMPLILYLSVGVFEEMLFRGYLFQTVEARWGSGAALVATSLVFGLLHLVNRVPGVTPLERLAGPVFICLEAGFPLAAAYLLTRRWWLSIGIHWAWDFCEGPVFGLHDSGTTDPHTLLRSQVTGPFLSTGGPFGPEASLPLLLTGTLLGVVLLCAAIKRGQWQPRRTASADPHG